MIIPTFRSESGTLVYLICIILAQGAAKKQLYVQIIDSIFYHGETLLQAYHGKIITRSNILVHIVMNILKKFYDRYTGVLKE